MNSGSSSTSTPKVDQDAKMAQNNEEDQALKELIAVWEQKTFQGDQIPELVECLVSNEQAKYQYALIGLRKILSNADYPPIQAIIDAKVVPRMIELCSFSYSQKTQFEAAWCLTNICSGTTEQTQYAIQNGVLGALLSLLKSNNEEVIEQSIWALGNISGDSTQFRDMILQQNGAEVLASVLQNATSLTLKRNGAWALSNLCREKPPAPFALISPAIPVFCQLLADDDQEALSNIAWALSFLTDNPEGISRVLSNNAVPRLVQLLAGNELTFVLPVMRTIGNIISGTDEQTAVVLKEEDFIPHLFKLAENKKKNIRREAFWMISNITAGSPTQFEIIMGNPAYVELLIKTAKNDIPEVKKEATWALSNSTNTCTPAQVIRLLDNGVFGCLVELLEQQDAKNLMVALEGIENCLKWGQQFHIKNENGDNKFTVEMEAKGGLEKIEELQSHENAEVYEKALKILETYFVGEEDVDAEGPAAADGSNINFNF